METKTWHDREPSDGPGMQPGVLYLVGTPIGNLSDLSPRAAAVLAEADWIAAEDTRHTLKLLHVLGLKKHLSAITSSTPANANPCSWTSFVRAAGWP